MQESLLSPAMPATPSAGEVADIPTRACRRGKHNSSGSQPQCVSAEGFTPMGMWLCLNGIWEKR